jgi:hypothetical protein
VLTTGKTETPNEAEPQFGEEDKAGDDDSDIPVSAVAAHVLADGVAPVGYGLDEYRSLVQVAEAEEIEDSVEDEGAVVTLGRGE